MRLQNNRELLEVIAQKAGCSYISDLILASFKDAVRTVIEKLDENEYSLADWQETVRYLLDDETVVITSKTKAKNTILRKYKK